MTAPAMTAHAIPGVHPKLNATHVREQLDALALQTMTLSAHVACGALRFARPAERAAVRDAMALLALLGLAQHVDRWEPA
jgi:hypothetical protein